MTQVKITSKFISVNGVKIEVRYDTGPWIDSVNPALIKVRPKNKSVFPQEFNSIFNVRNDSDSREDYFESDQIRILPSHDYYSQINKASQS